MAALSGGAAVLDFKTDVPPIDEEPMSSRYIDQVRGYVRALEQTLHLGPIRAGLLFSADGIVRWLSPETHAATLYLEEP